MVARFGAALPSGKTYGDVTLGDDVPDNGQNYPTWTDRRYIKPFSEGPFPPKVQLLLTMLCCVNREQQQQLLPTPRFLSDEAEIPRVTVITTLSPIRIHLQSSEVMYTRLPGIMLLKPELWYM
ncbi:uncharacterized protein LOC120412408 [Culex pipiens pallens]|uniref:uncharacterized protein LOC120412408 n=1 Tax=Culex pipiens pallens TaxID=42434 RepID=UPI001953B86F|nr:uncharacterized protein LOC120412408 [Culex pipiens pallens]XP_052565261.1 uncharacterized protein LOC120412408 [Culex pipiens pallens]